VAEKIRSTEKSNDFVGNGIHDLLACSILPQPTMLLRAPLRIHKQTYVSKQDQ
jgi:hypothetical protein